MLPEASSKGSSNRSAAAPDAPPALIDVVGFGVDLEPDGLAGFGGRAVGRVAAEIVVSRARLGASDPEGFLQM